MKLVSDNTSIKTKIKTNGVTILMNNQIFFTQLPTKADQEFVAKASYWIMDFQKGSKPNG